MISMSKKFDELNDAFDVSGDIVSSEIEKVEPAKERKDPKAKLREAYDKHATKLTSEYLTKELIAQKEAKDIFWGNEKFEDFEYVWEK